MTVSLGRARAALGIRSAGLHDLQQGIQRAGRLLLIEHHGVQALAHLLDD